MSLRCVVCDEVMVDENNHHCDPKRLAAIERGRQNAERMAEEDERPQPYYGTRLAAGMWLSDQEGNVR